MCHILQLFDQNNEDDNHLKIQVFPIDTESERKLHLSMSMSRPLNLNRQIFIFFFFISQKLTLLIS